MVSNPEMLASPLTHQGAAGNSETAQSHEALTCALCHLPARSSITLTVGASAVGASAVGASAVGASVVSTANNRERAETHHFCCYGCRHIYELVAPDLAQGMTLPQAMGHAGLDLNAPCCRGILHGDPVEESRRILSRLMFNAFLTMMVMVVSLALYSDFFFAWEESGQGFRSMLQVLAMLFATPAVLLLAIPILEDAVLTFQVYRRLTMSALIAIGTLAAYGISVYATFTGRGHTYFETASMTLLLVTLGRWLDARTQIEGNRALDTLLAQAPTTASRLLDNGPEENGSEELVELEAIQVGDRVRVRPGENFAVDGVVFLGEGSVNEASITGESTPSYKRQGDAVYAGTLNVDGRIEMTVTHTGEDRVMGKLVRLLDEARLHRAPIERLADRMAGAFVPVVLLLALGALAYWSWQAGLETGVINSLAVVLIACPCALGIATPLTLWIGLGRAAQQGILIRDSLTLEKLSRVRHLFFDKTGTLTTGERSLAEIVVDFNIKNADLVIGSSSSTGLMPIGIKPNESVYIVHCHSEPLGIHLDCTRPKSSQTCRLPTSWAKNPSSHERSRDSSVARGSLRMTSLGLLPLHLMPMGKMPVCHRQGCLGYFDETIPCGRLQLLQIVASVEQASEHPLAASIRAEAQRQNLPLLPADHFQNRPGLGVTGMVDGQQIFVGNWRLLEREGLALSDEQEGERRRLEIGGLTVVFVAWSGAVRGMLAFSEAIRPSAPVTLNQLTQAGIKLDILTGDSTTAAEALVQRLDHSGRLALSAQSELLPPEKVAQIAQAEVVGPVGMIGDGLNDAPALARASVGIAMGCGADVTREAADVSLLGTDLTQIPWLLSLARRTYRTIQWNLLWAFVYNVVGIGLALAGLLHPLLAAVAMVLSSLLVVGNTLRLRGFSVKG